MKSKWKVTSNQIDGKTMYAVSRIRDTNWVEMTGGYIESREDAQRQADELNKEKNKNV